MFSSQISNNSDFVASANFPVKVRKSCNALHQTKSFFTALTAPQKIRTGIRAQAASFITFWFIYLKLK